MTDIDWVGTIGCEGGPVMVVDLPGFAQWTGAAPFTMLREAAPTPERAARFADKMRTLHYWGQFTDQLPEPFAAEGGHQYLACASEEEARAKLSALRDAIKAKFPDVVVSEDDEQTHFLLPEGEDQLWAELAPKSEYDASWQANEDEQAWGHTFGTDARALFWEIEGAGCADVGVSKSGDEIVLVRSWLSGEDETEKEEQAAAHALAATPGANEVAAGEVVIASGRAVVIWSPIAPFQLRGIEGREALAALGESGDPPELGTEMIGGVGTVVRVKPGRYAVTIASTDDDDDDDGDDGDGDEADDEADERPWSARWCRLKWVG